MTTAESRSIVSWLAPELPEEIPRHQLVKGLIMFHEDTCVDTDVEDDLIFATYPVVEKATDDDEEVPL